MARYNEQGGCVKTITNRLTGSSPEPMLAPKGARGGARNRRIEESENMTVTSEGTSRERRPVDLINASRLLSEEEKGVRDLVREFVDREVIPTAADHWDRAEFPFGVLPGLGELGIMGGTISEEYGCAGWNNVAYGLAIAELARGSGSLAT